jgi:hypothetical protein
MPPVIALTVPVAAGSAPTAAGWLTVPGWLVGCDPLAEPWTAWAALWTMLMAAGAAGEDGTWAVWPPLAAVLAGTAGTLAGVLTGTAGTLTGTAGTLTGTAGTLAGAAGTLAGVLTGTAGTLAGMLAGAAGALAAAWLAGPAWAVGCEPLAEPWVA